MRRKQWIGLGLIVLSIAAMVLWETVLRDRMMFRTITVCSRDIAYGDVITRDCFKTVRTTPSSCIQGALGEEQLPALYGLCAVVPLKENQQLLPQYFAKDKEPEAPRYSFVIEEEWLSPRSRLMREDDLVGLYTADEGLYLGSYRVSYIPSSDNGMELVCTLDEYLMIRHAALENGEGSIVAADESRR